MRCLSYGSFVSRKAAYPEMAVRAPETCCRTGKISYLKNYVLYLPNKARGNMAPRYRVVARLVFEDNKDNLQYLGEKRPWTVSQSVAAGEPEKFGCLW